MKYRWIVYEHHIAIDASDEILHPNADEIFEFVAGDNKEISAENPTIALNSLRFSKIGSPIKCELYSDEDGKLFLNLYTFRKNHKYSVDMIEGQIIDHCVSDREWFYLNGDIDTLETLFANAGIKECGVINTGQYIQLMKQEYFAEHREIINNVDSSVFSSLMVPEGNVPEGINADLYAYQKTGFLWMRNMISAGSGCILGDEMGLGKTLQIITLFQDMKLNNNVPVLVVAPVSLLENWKRESAKFAPKLDVYIHHGSKRTGLASVLSSHDVVVISYNTAVSDLSMLKMINWKCVVLDEAQNIKNPYSERARSVKSITRKAGIAVTGTPFENHITDIWSLVDFSIPGLFGSLSSFKQNISDDVLGAEKIEPLLSPIMIRRLVKDVANDLPEKVIVSQPISMSEEERQEYERYRADARGSVENGSAVTLAVLQKLRMFCTHRFLCEDNGRQDPWIVSIKYQRLCELIEEIISRDEKIIIFTSYKRMFEIFRQDIPSRFGLSIDTINGETPVEERQKIVDWFNNYKGSAILVLNPRAAGTGLNITGANHVIHYNLEWNPALEDQSSARAYRRGQEKTVFIYRLFYSGTVEEIVNDRIERKREMAVAAVIGTDGSDEKSDILRALELAPEIQKG